MNNYWADNFDWRQTTARHIWQNMTIGTYHFSDEASMLDETPYKTMTECRQALDNYVEMLG